MKKQTVYGLPLNPIKLLEEIKGSSFCVSYATRDRLGKQLEQAIELVGEDQILLVDNGAYTSWRKGIDTMNDEEYLEGYASWANTILDRCPQAVAVFPDVIDGNQDQNWQLVQDMMMLIDSDRAMPVWHMHEDISYFLNLCEGFNYIAIGSSGDYRTPGKPNWHNRMKELFAALDKWELESEGAYVRPRIHLMRAQAFAHLYPIDSSDSTNVAVNHSRQLRKKGETVAMSAARVDAKIQKSAGPEAEHQIKQPLDWHVQEYAQDLAKATAPGATELDLWLFNYRHGDLPAAPDYSDIPEFLRRAA